MRGQWGRRAAGALSAVGMLGAAATAGADEPPNAEVRDDARTMAGHRFVVSQSRFSTFENPQFPSPFATTDFAMLVGMGYGSVEIDDPEVASVLREVRLRPEIDLVTLTVG